MIVFYAQCNHFHQAFGIDDLTIAIQARVDLVFAQTRTE
ncbi:Uncharacterised protein [Vibrio cholerae]|nr:Uncharacterised protein [Vibrio cholerae]